MDRWPYTYNQLPQAAQQYSSSGTSAQAQLLLQHQLRQAAHQAQQAQAAQEAQQAREQQAQQLREQQAREQQAREQQVREQQAAQARAAQQAQAQAAQNQYLPPSLVAAANNKHHSSQSSSWKSSSSSNSNGLVIIPEPQKASHRSSNDLLGENSRSMRQAAELKTSQPIFPGQPPPLARVDHNKQNYAQPPPRQSSQVSQRSSSSSSSASVNRTAFPGQAPPTASTASGGSNFREPLFQQQRPDLIIQRQQPSPQLIQQQSPQTQSTYNNPSPQSVASPQGYYQNPSPHDSYYQQQLQQQQQQLQQEKSRSSSSHNKSSSRSSSSHNSSSSEQRQREREQRERQAEKERQKQLQQQQLLQQQQQQQLLQQQQQQQQVQQQQQQQQDVGLARLGALGALADLGNDGDLMNETPTINYEDLNFGGGSSSRQRKSEANQWVSRATELLDLSSGDSRDTPGDQEMFQQQSNNQNQGQGLIPQIVMNPWDPNQAPMMTFALQTYQHQWLLQQQQQQQQLGSQDEEAAITHEMEEEAFQKNKVICIPPDDEMGFLLNLPPPCNVVLQPSQIGLSGKVPESPFMQAYQKFLRGETTVKAPAPVDEPPPPDELPGKKKYIPPYTPNLDKLKQNPSYNTARSAPSTVTSRSSSSSSSFKPRTAPNRPVNQPNRTVHNPVQSQQQFFANKNAMKKYERSQAVSDDEDDEVPIVKRESSRRKAKENLSKKIHQQERLVEEDDDALPGLDLSDSDDDATWAPSMAKDKSATSRHKRLVSEDEEDMEYRMAVSTPKKKKTNFFHTTSLVPADQDFRPGDFVILKDDQNQDQAPVWRFDNKTLLQRFNTAGVDDHGDTIYKSANLFSGYIASNRQRYVSVAVKFVSSEGNATVVKVVKNNSSSDDHQNNTNNPEIRKRSYAETAQFQENFEVYIQALISQCLDANFLDEVFSDQDDYFVSNIEKVDSVTLLRKDKVMNGVGWALRFTQSVNTWPCLNDLGAAGVSESKCGACETERAALMIQLFGQPYHQNTLKPTVPSEQACMSRNFNLCKKCSRLAQLYHKLQHQKQSMFTVCSDVVETRRKNSPGLDTTRMLNELLADDTWLESRFRAMQDLWADADTFVR